MGDTRRRLVLGQEACAGRARSGGKRGKGGEGLGAEKGLVVIVTGSSFVGAGAGDMRVGDVCTAQSVNIQ